jgi:hypothetical protein
MAVGPAGVPSTTFEDCEFERESDPPPPREDVRSKRRVWYAKGPKTEPDLGLDEGLEETEFERSMQRPRPRRS